MSLGRFILQNTKLQEQFCNCLFTQEWFPFFFQNCVLSHFRVAADCSWSHFPVLLSLRDQSLYSRTWAWCLAYNRHSAHFFFWINKCVSLSTYPLFANLRTFITKSIQFQLNWLWQKFLPTSKPHHYILCSAWDLRGKCLQGGQTEGECRTEGC